MISEKEYEVLHLIKNKQTIKTKLYSQEIHSLLSEGFMELSKPYKRGINEYVYNGCYITPKGERAYRDYNEHQKELFKSNITFWISVTSALIAVASLLVSIFKP